MPFLTQGKTNWKFLLIVVVLAVVTGSIIYLQTIKEDAEVIPPDISEKVEKDIEELSQIALLVCEEYELEYYDPNWEAGWKERFAQPGPVYPIAFTGSEKKEVLGLCGPGAFGGYTMMFVLSNEGDIIFQKGPELSALAGGRYYIFEDIAIIDIDGDGIEEIAYREGTWTRGMSRSEIHLYAPKHNEWMYVIYDSEGVFDEQKKEDVWTIRSVDYSENLERLEYQIFKKAFQQIIENIQQKIELSKGIPSLEEILKEVNVWQTYRNEKYGFEIKYPINYQIDWANEHDGDSGLLFSLRLSSLRELPFYYLSVRETEYKDIDVWFENWRQETEKPYRYEGDDMPAPKIILSENRIINDIKSKKTITDGLPYANGGRLNVIKDGHIYDFAGFTTTGFTTEEDQAFIDQVISTFRFIKDVPERKLEYTIPEKLKEDIVSEEVGPKIINAAFDFEGFRKEIVFSISEEEEILRLKIKDRSGYLPELGLEELRLANLVYSADPSLRVNEVAIYVQPGTFYFFLADEIICGATGNCSWVFYKYDSEKEEFSNFKEEEAELDKFKEFFGFLPRADGFIVSPDRQKIIFPSHSRGGSMNIGGNIWMIDVLKEDVNYILTGRTYFPGYSYARIYSLAWENNECIIFNVELKDEEKWMAEIQETVFREYKYCYLVDILELLNENKEIIEG